jgi:TRAP-type C4-dicarboxylate transport system substrate-binding protein
VPVSLRNNGNAVDTAVFALAYDASKLSFNADDASAVSLSDGQLAMVNAVDGRVEIVVTGLSATDGAVANINLSVKENANGDVAISLADSSLGSEGGTVAVDTADGAIQIGDAGSTNFRSLLPIIRK